MYKNLLITWFHHVKVQTALNQINAAIPDSKQIDYLLASMPAVEGGFDYNSFAENY
ncbi:hypothetical protein DDB_G0268806 [Dictyostelium discoideum AX4]|uniref:Uncharacterized protein n=1 Tax=Dictyostelium discoideum TaxID=44689 RepID=Q55EN9_DICDI|nr:hypothetical protein DDB_G0268806 [Dictyostelium discoideum AX4]EAL72992.1 hypothetical protein DDB_G0268806 [Dictyostelium discoideum AX4]|eukprot:XP_646981.1 hypothetical protein DDB_G0268806 [Dictyostelium discoideum AX4]